MKSIIFFVIIFFSVFVTYAQNKFPVPDAEEEFIILTKERNVIAKEIKGDEQKFISLTLPYAPLSLEITQANSSEDAEDLRNFYLGFISRSAQVNVFEIIKRFHCDPICINKRIKYLKTKLPNIIFVVQTIRQYPRLFLIAQWSEKDYRINNFFYEKNMFSESLPSPKMGFVPSGKWKSNISEKIILNRTGMNYKQLKELLTGIRQADLAAIVRQSDGVIRAVWAGISDDETGLLFVENNAKLPKLYQKQTWGGEFVLLKEINPGIYFYITS